MKLLFLSMFLFSCGGPDNDYQIYKITAEPQSSPSSCGDIEPFSSYLIIRDNKVFINTLVFNYNPAGVNFYTDSKGQWAITLLKSGNKIDALLSLGVEPQGNGYFKCFDDWEIKGERM